MAIFKQLRADVSEVNTARKSTVLLLAGVKMKLDQGIKDAEHGQLDKLRFLSDELDTNTDDLAKAVIENTPHTDDEPEPDAQTKRIEKAAKKKS